MTIIVKYRAYFTCTIVTIMIRSLTLLQKYCQSLASINDM